MRPNTPAATVGAIVVIVLLVGLAFATMGQPGASPGPSASTVPSASIAIASADASLSPLVSAGPTASATASTGTPSTTPTPTPTSAATPTVAPTPTVKPTATPTPTKPPSGSFVFVSVRGRDISGQDASGGGTITVVDESIVVSSTGGSDQTTVTYEIPPEDLPDGVEFDRLDVRICGVASGDAWELDGPSGSTPDARVTEPPANDGCWHFARGNAKNSALLVAVSGDTEVRVDRVIYRLRVE
jgi:hypothetical protein